jgi:mannose-6-phosphate isomerase-like protein (cupin superfamily)
MNIILKNQVKKHVVSETLTAYEYPVMDKSIHGAVTELKGRYPEKGFVINQVCTEIAYVIEGEGKLVFENEVIEFKKGDQMLIKPGQKFYWDAHATLFVPCTPAWYPQQHVDVE